MPEKKKFYLTKEGLKKLRAEYEFLKNLRISKMKGEVPKILESEDLNPEYLVFQQDLILLERKMAEFGNILKNVELIKTPPKKEQDKVGLGSKVILDVDGDVDEFTIVGTLEANPSLGKISNESPVGKALLGHEIGDEVIVSSPIKTVYKIRKIKYS